MSGQQAPQPLALSGRDSSPLQPADPKVKPNITELAKRIVEIGDKLYFEYLIRNRNMLSKVSDTTTDPTRS